MDNDLTEATLVLIPAVIAIGLLSFAVQILAMPFRISHVTVMYVDQLRRNELPLGYRPGIYPPVGPMSHPRGPAPAGPGGYEPNLWNPPYQQQPQAHIPEPSADLD